MIDGESEQGANNKVTTESEDQQRANNIEPETADSMLGGRKPREPRHGASELQGEPGREAGEQSPSLSTYLSTYERASDR